MNNSEYELETIKHIRLVREYLMQVIIDITLRANLHDDTKLYEPESELFKKYTPLLRESTYLSKDYKKFLKDLKPALDHHYMCNRHHPEHFENGIIDMNLIDLLEMLIDWIAAVKRHNDGDIHSSIEKNMGRFKYSEELKKVFLNTVTYINNWDTVEVD